MLPNTVTDFFGHQCGFDHVAACQKVVNASVYRKPGGRYLLHCQQPACRILHWTFEGKRPDANWSVELYITTAHMHMQDYTS